MSNASYDYIVVGGGSAGVVVAARLAEDRHLRIALVEAGPNDRDIRQIRELSRWQSLLESRYDYNYAIEPQSRGNSCVRHSRGRMLGGCSSHNSCISFVAPDYDFARWAEVAGDTWDAESVRPYYGRVQQIVNREHSESGNAAVEGFLSAAAQIGFPRTDFTGPFDESAGWFLLNKRGYLRESSSAAYFHGQGGIPENISLYSETTVTRLTGEPEADGTFRATGVETSAGTLSAEREVILSAGAFDTPKLLMLSGIGPDGELARHGIETRVALAGVGQHLLDHPEGVVIFEADDPVPPETSQHYEAGLFARVEKEAGWPDLMLHLGTQCFDMHTGPAGYPSSANAISLTPNVARAKSEGVVRLKSADPVDPPSIDFRYFTDPYGYDEKIMIEGIRLSRRLAAQDAMKRWARRELAPGPAVQSDRQIASYIRKTHNTVYHPVGTCRIGRDEDPMAVVDPMLRVRGTAGLRIADASVFPHLTSVNPNMTVYMVGERCADFIRASGHPPG
ncbi:MAG: GMC family oxidoreductase [Spirochaetales bacterium]